MPTMRHIAFAPFDAQRPLHEGSLPDVNGKCFHAVVWGKYIVCGNKKKPRGVCGSVRLPSALWVESILYYAI